MSSPCTWFAQRPGLSLQMSLHGVAILGQQETEKVKGAEKEKGRSQAVHCRVDQECLVAES